MKHILSIICLCLITNVLTSQTFYSDFEDGTLGGWTNTDGSLDGLSVETATVNFLRKDANGTPTPQGTLAIINEDDNHWKGNYFYNLDGKIVLHTIDDIVLRNLNNFDLHIRYAFTGANGYTVFTTEPLIIPANSMEWGFYNLGYFADFQLNSLSNLTIVNDTNGIPWEEVMQNIQELFEEVVQVKIYHNPASTDQAAPVTGTLEVESILSYELLDISEASATVGLYPNPIKDRLQVNATNFISKLAIYNTQGARILEQKFNAAEGILDLSQIDSGVYLLELVFDNGTTTTKKLVKE